MGSERSAAAITERDLARFGKFAVQGHKRKCEFRSELRGRLVAACLAQGGAAHLLDPSIGLKDIDLWLYYDTTGTRPIGAKAIVNFDLGPSKFGRHPDDPPKYVGRRIDVMARSLPDSAVGLDPADAVRTWLSGPQESPKLLRQKPVILLWPPLRRGEILWEPNA